MQLACENSIKNLTKINCDFPSYVHPLFRTELQKKLAAIELENKSIRDEFNVQRAKLKDIFLQKEGLRTLRSVNLSYVLMLVPFVKVLPNKI